MNSDSDVEKIKDRLSIVEVVGQYVPLQKAGKNYRARCPFHKERTPSFHVSPERGSYMCFGCGEKGDIFSFVQKIEGVDFKTALAQLAQKAGIVLSHTYVAVPEAKEKEERLRDVCDAAVEFFQTELRARADVGEYLRARGVLPETIEEWRLGYAPASWRKLSEWLLARGFGAEDTVEAGLALRREKKSPNGEVSLYDRFRGRVMFPINDVQGKIIAFSGRFFEDMPEGGKKASDIQEPAKYVNSPETPLFRKSRVLYGLDRAKTSMRKADCILLVEGQFDLILCHQSGLPFTVALSGTALTPEHLSLLGRFSKRLVLALDADVAGLRSGLRSSMMAIAAGFDVKIPTFPPGKDPADLARENPELLKSAIRTSETAVEFFLGALRRALSAKQDERAYKKLVEAQVLPLIAAMESKIEQEHFIALVSRTLMVSDSAVREELRKHKTPPSTDTTSETSPLTANETIDPLEKKIAILFSYFGPGSDIHLRLLALVGKGRLEAIGEQHRARAEEWRFIFERELGEHTSEEIIASDMLAEIERVVERERFKMKFM